MRPRQIQILCHACTMWSANRRTTGIPSITNNKSGASALSSASSVYQIFSLLCLPVEIKMSSQKKKKKNKPKKHQTKKERMFKFKETKFILIPRSGKMEPPTLSKRNFVCFPLHSRDQIAHWLGSDFKFSYHHAMLLVTPFLVGGLAESRTQLHVYWEVLGIKKTIQAILVQFKVSVNVWALIKNKQL